ncbi:hypothetical protein EBR57_05815, partial [bacterium]|nr:hypothetical protein [bacterium]
CEHLIQITLLLLSITMVAGYFATYPFKRTNTMIHFLECHMDTDFLTLPLSLDLNTRELKALMPGVRSLQITYQHALVVGSWSLLSILAPL